MGNLGFPELIFIFVIALLIFGPKRLPELGRSLGKGISEFKRATNGLKDTIEREIHTAEQEANAIANQATAAPGKSVDAPKS